MIEFGRVSRFMMPRGSSEVYLVRFTDSEQVLPPSCSWMPHVRLILLQSDCVSSVDTGATVIFANVLPRSPVEH